MLQQTQAARVEPAFIAFVRRFPTVRALAGADRAAVLRTWAGLGYNRRAVSLHRAARAVMRDHGGHVPVEPSALRTLPGVGPYTAAAVASIAGGLPVPAIDVNVRRIVARVADADDAPASTVASIAEAWLDRSDPGAWNQALMDLGREHCRATPRCDGCPLSGWCAHRRSGLVVVERPERRKPPFAGSRRELRGKIVGALRSRPSAGAAGLARATGSPVHLVEEAILGLERDGLVERTGRSYRLPTGE